MARLLLESSYQFEIHEDKNKDMYLMGVFSVADERNRNNRVYPREILERAIDELQESIKGRTCVGQIGHPESPETDLNKAAILTEDLQWGTGKDHNKVYGKAKVLNNPNGEIIKKLKEDGVSLGISSRGLGSLSEDGTVNEDLQILCWDVVASPSCQHSWVQTVVESKEFPSAYDLKKNHSSLIEYYQNISKGLNELLETYDARKLKKKNIQVWKNNSMVRTIDLKTAQEMVNKGTAKIINDQAIEVI